MAETTIFELFPDHDRLLYYSRWVAHANSVMAWNPDPFFRELEKHRHPLQAKHDGKVYPRGYILLNDTPETQKYRRELPEMFEQLIMPGIRKTANSSRCNESDDWIQNYAGRGLAYIDDPRDNEVFLYSCLMGAENNPFNRDVRSSMEHLLEMYGGERERWAKNMLDDHTSPLEKAREAVLDMYFPQFN